MTETPKWKDGTYRMSSLSHVIFKVVGESCKAEPLSGKMDDSISLGTWKYGDCGQAHPDVAKAAGRGAVCCCGRQGGHGEAADENDGRHQEEEI